MAIYVASSPYRSSLGKKKINISFPKLHGLFARSRHGSGISIQDRRERNAVNHAGNVFARNGGDSGGNTLSGSMKKVRVAVTRFEFGPSTVIFGLSIIAILMSLLYLMHFNQVATKGYDLRRLEAARQELLNQYDIKNMKLAEVKSLARVIASDRVSAMRKPAEVIFVRGNTALASLP
jgi:hypothetical protein